MGTIIKETEFYTLLRKDEGGFEATIKSAALSGVPGLPGITLEDTSELRLALRVNKIVNESINPSDPHARLILAAQRKAYQQALL